MHLKDFSLLSPVIQSSDLLKAIETAIPPTAIEQAIAKTKASEERNRSSPAQLVVCLVIAMSLWSRDSWRDVLKNLIDGLAEGWVKVGKYWRVPCKSAITQARQRLKPRVMSQLFHQLVQPMATEDTLGAFLNGLRIVVIDGTCCRTSMPKGLKHALASDYPFTALYSPLFTDNPINSRRYLQ